MESIIASHLKPELYPVVLMKTDEKPTGAKQAKADVYYCIMTMFAQAAKGGKTVAFDRETYGCPGARAGLGFGTDYDKVNGGYDTFSAFFAKGIEDAKDKEAYRARAEKMNPHVCQKHIEGERFHTNREKALKWISEDLPIYDFPEKYRVLKPLHDLKEDEVPESVIFTVNALQLTTLITLAGSIRTGINTMVTPQGAACQMMGAYVFKEAESEDPSAVLGMIDLAARATVRKMLPQDVLSFSVPWKLFLLLEEEAKEGVFKSPLWTNMQ